MLILHLTLNKQWFDMIESGIKTEEYRLIKDYWTSRLFTHKPYSVNYPAGFLSPINFDAIEFRNGYHKNCRTMLVEFKGVINSFGKPEWGAPNHSVYIIKLGNIISSPKHLPF